MGVYDFSFNKKTYWNWHSALISVHAHTVEFMSPIVYWYCGLLDVNYKIITLYDANFITECNLH